MNNSNNGSINCIQINLQRSKTSTANLLKTIEEYNIDIVIAQEPHVINGKVIGFLLNYSVLYDQNSTHPKIVIIITNNLIQNIFIQTFSNNFLTIICYQFSAKPIVIFSAYGSPFEDLNQELIHIQNAINVLKPNNYIICVDTNSHSKVWFNDNEF
jgi:hypothetical protein